MGLEVYTRRDQDAYQQGLANLFPRGIAWPRALSSVFMRLLRGLAGILAYVDQRTEDFGRREMWPDTTIEMLPDWERNFGLPDPCLDEPFSITDRQKALVRRMTFVGGQSMPFWIALAADMGYPITITEYRPFICGVDRCGESRLGPNLGRTYWIGPPELRFYWTVHVFDKPIRWLRAGSGHAGDHMATIARATDLECVFRRGRRADTTVFFDYSPLT